jgi:hypothetical protein
MNDTHGYLQYEAARGLKQLWVVSKAGHGEYLTINPTAYEQQAIDFYDHWLLGGG